MTDPMFWGNSSYNPLERPGRKPMPAYANNYSRQFVEIPEDNKDFIIGLSHKTLPATEQSPVFLANQLYGLPEFKEALLKDPSRLPQIADKVYAEILADSIMRREVINSVFAEQSPEGNQSAIIAANEALNKHENHLLKIIAIRMPKGGN